MISQLNRARQTHLQAMIVSVIAIIVGCGIFTVGICQKESTFRKACLAISFLSLVGASISRKVVRINEDYLQRTTDILEQAEDDKIVENSRPMRKPNSIELLRSAKPTHEDDQFYIGW